MAPHSGHLLAACLALVVDVAWPQGLPAETQDAMPLGDYLGLLEQIAPAARQGAEAYLVAHRQKCGRSLSTGELRLAMSKDGGDPALMGLIRASQLQDAKAVSELGRTLACRGRK